MSVCVCLGCMAGRTTNPLTRRVWYSPRVHERLLERARETARCILLVWRDNKWANRRGAERLKPTDAAHPHRDRRPDRQGARTPRGRRRRGSPAGPCAVAVRAAAARPRDFGATLDAIGAAAHPALFRIYIRSIDLGSQGSCDHRPAYLLAFETRFV